MPTALDRIGDRSRRTVAKSRTRRKTLIVERVYLPAFKTVASLIAGIGEFSSDNVGGFFVDSSRDIVKVEIVAPPEIAELERFNQHHLHHRITLLVVATWCFGRTCQRRCPGVFDGHRHSRANVILGEREAVAFLECCGLRMPALEAAQQTPNSDLLYGCPLPSCPLQDARAILRVIFSAEPRLSFLRACGPTTPFQASDKISTRCESRADALAAYSG